MYCVIVGDIINSREIEPDTREMVTRAAKDVFEKINTNYIDSLMTTFGMVRGDAFEGILLTQYQAPEIVQEIIKAFYCAEKTAVRISVVVGELTATGSDRNDADGPAFHMAIEALSKMKERKSKHWLQVSFFTNSLAQPLVDSQFTLLTALTERWTEKQREIAWEMEAHGGYQKLVSKKMGISPTVVNKQIKSAQYDAYRQAWDNLKDYLIAMDEHTISDKPEPPKSYISYYSVAMRKYKQTLYSEALPLFLKSLDFAKIDLGSDDPQLIPIYNALAEIYAINKDYDKAEEAVQLSVQLQESMPKARLQYAETLRVKADLYYVLKKYIEARKYAEEGLSVAHNALDEEHPFIGILNNTLALIYQGLGEYENALNIYTKVLDIAKASKSKNPIDYATVTYNIALCYYEMHKFRQGIPYAEKALRICKDNLPPKHHYIIESLELLTDLKSHQGDDML